MQVQFDLDYKYNFDSALKRLERDPIHHVDFMNRHMRIPMEAGNIIDIYSLGTTDIPSFRLDGAFNDEQIKEIKSIFHMDRPLDHITNHFQTTELASIFKEYEGTPLIKSFSLYGTLMRNIIHQQLNMSFANTLTMRFVEAYGEDVEGVKRYPSPEKIAVLNTVELREMQFSLRKAEYVIGISQAIVEGSLNLNELKEASDKEVMNKLTSYRGIGPWTAQNFLLSALGRPNLFPVADVGLQNALKHVWRMDRKPKKEEMVERFPDWSPYLSYAALYLWKSIET